MFLQDLNNLKAQLAIKNSHLDEATNKFKNADCNKVAEAYLDKCNKLKKEIKELETKIAEYGN